jgi:gliding motility-associated-like protein
MKYLFLLGFAVSFGMANVVNYSIDNGATSQANGNFSALCPGTYTVVVDNGFGCTDDSTFTISEPAEIELTNWPSNATLCPGESLTLNASGTPTTAGTDVYTWEAGGVVLGTGSPFDIVSTGSMLVCVTMSDDCPNTKTECFNISEPAPITFGMGSTNPNGCDPHMVTFYNDSYGSPILNTVWTFSDGTTAVIQGADSIQHLFQGAGVYDVGMEITTTAGCVYDTTFYSYVEVYPNPEANFTWAPIPATIYDTEINFTDFSSDDVTTWYWNLGAGVPGSASVQNPTAVYPEGIPGDYPVQLKVWNDYGCEDSLNAVVSVVNDVILYAPNIFTPDGDEYNETWRVQITGIDIYDFHLTMFNRWGEIVWESFNTEGVWNGHYGGGGMVQDGTYIWVIEAKDVYTDKKYEFRGHVTVLK